MDLDLKTTSSSQSKLEIRMFSSFNNLFLKYFRKISIVGIAVPFPLSSIFKIKSSNSKDNISSNVGIEYLFSNRKNLIFFRSPIGKALISKNEGEMISVNTPSGERNFEILKVEYI